MAMMKNTDFRIREDEIKAIVEKIDDEDSNWHWTAKVADEYCIELHWEYLEYLEEEIPFFTIRYDEDLNMYAAYAENGWFMNWELEDTTSLEGIMRSVAYYAMSRY